jgi:hypothetical protein
MVVDADPHLVFANFGDIDRFGHGDFTGSTVQAQRQARCATPTGCKGAAGVTAQ